MKTPRKVGTYSGPFYHAVILVSAFMVLAWQFVFPGYYHKFVEDAIYTPCYIAQFTESFRQGIYYPRWMPLCFDGYGSPVFIFYSPLLYILTGLMHLVGPDIPTSVNLLKLLAVYAGGVSVFFLVREDHADRSALIAAVCYVLLPSSLLENYMINTPAGRLGQAWLPLTLLAVRRLVRDPASRGNVTLIAVSYSGLILSHLATAFIFSPFIAVYGLWSGKNPPIQRGALRLAIGIGAGLCLSAVLLLPVILERSLVQTNLLETIRYMSDWRKPLLLAFDTPVKDDVRHLWNLTRYCIFIESGVAATLFYLLRRNTSFSLGRSEKACLWLYVAAIFMMSTLSGPLWQYLPGMASVNFPSRFLSVSMVFISLLIGLMLDAFMRWGGRPKAVTAGVAAIILLVAACDGLLVYRSLPPTSSARAEKYCGRVDMVEYLPATADLQTLYGLDDKDPLLSNTDPFIGLNSTVPLLTSKDKFSYAIFRWGYVDRKFSVDSPEGARLRVRTFYFPGWKAWVDGAEVPIGVQDKTGAMLIDVPTGNHTVELLFTDTWPRKAGWIISIVTLILLVFPYGRLRTLRGQAV